jgi:hypothetical protein
MGAQRKEHAFQVVARPWDGEPEDQTPRINADITHAKFSQPFEPPGEEGFPELPEFLRRVR